MKFDYSFSGRNKIFRKKRKIRKKKKITIIIANILTKIKTKKIKTKKIVFIGAGVLAAFLLGIGLYVYINISKMYQGLEIESNAAVTDDYETNAEASALPEISLNDEITVEPVEKPTGTVDIILLGVDNRNNDFTGRTDTMVFMRVDMSNSKIKMVSLMRDTLVKMKDRPRNKLNTAFRFGSIDLLKSTLENNFGLSPDYYIVVNFYGMEDIIDALGGVEIDVKPNEKSNMNDSIRELNDVDKDNQSPYIKESGLQNLNGRQAVAYMRTRHVGGQGDEGRIERQQAVLSALFNKAKNINLGQIPGLINTVAQYVRTNIPISEMLKLANAIKGLNVGNLETYRFPDIYELGRYKEMSVVQPENLKDEIDKLNKFLE